MFLHVFHSKPDLTESAKVGLNKILASEVPIEIKPVNPALFYRISPGEPRRYFWGRARGYIGKMLVFNICIPYCLISHLVC